jgi:hypothetical protein
MPKGASDTGFLKGCWSSDSGSKNNFGQPAVFRYCFSDGGAGELTVEVKDSRGRVRQTCRAEAEATLDGATLRVRDSGAKCPAGEVFPPNTVVCEPGAGGPASCTGQPDSGKIAPVTLVREGG